jgi:xylan 1,4-beta-xylosidase
MGNPKYPTREQLAKLRQAAQLPPAESRTISGNELKIVLPPYCLALLELRELHK